MADYDSQLPIRSEADKNATRVADSTNAIIDPAKEAGNLLSVKTNTDPFVTPGGGGYIRQDSTGTIAKETGGNLDLIKANSDTLAGGVTASVYQENLKQVNGVTTETDFGTPSTGSLRVAAMLGVGSTPVSNTNPIPVNIVGAGGTNTLSYNTAAAVAANASNTHSFTPAADFLMQDIYASASGQMKVEIQWGITGAEATKNVQFTSKGDLNANFSLKDAQLITTLMTVKIIRTNLDNQAMDVYSTISGINA